MNDYSLSQHATDNLKGISLKQKLTEIDLICLEDLLDKYHPYAGEAKYADELYPMKALEILLFSRTIHWPHPLRVDDVLEYYLSKWYKDNLGAPSEYIKSLLSAVNDLQCIDGLFYRLNLDVLVDAVPDVVSIATAFGVIKQPSIIIQDSARQKSIEKLKEYGFYMNNINQLQATLERYRKSYSLEQALLSWVGYRIYKLMLQDGNSAPRLERTQARITLK